MVIRRMTKKKEKLVKFLEENGLEGYLLELAMINYALYKLTRNKACKCPLWKLVITIMHYNVLLSLVREIWPTLC